jgi:hypothetical protein
MPAQMEGAVGGPGICEQGAQRMDRLAHRHGSAERSVEAKSLVFGLWRICFPPVLFRTGRRLPVQALGERGVLVSLTGYPRGGAPGPG